MQTQRTKPLSAAGNLYGDQRMALGVAENCVVGGQDVTIIWLHARSVRAFISRWKVISAEFDIRVFVEIIAMGTALNFVWGQKKKKKSSVCLNTLTLWWFLSRTAQCRVPPKKSRERNHCAMCNCDRHRGPTYSSVSLVSHHLMSFAKFPIREECSGRLGASQSANTGFSLTGGQSISERGMSHLHGKRLRSKHPIYNSVI